MNTNPTESTIGNISNYYGGLSVKQENGKFFWSIENWDGQHWSEVPEYLFKALNRYEKQRKKIEAK